MLINSHACALLVEDNPTCLEALARVMSNMPQPWKLHAASTGAAALALLNRRDLPNPFSLAIVDIGLPDMSGVEVIATLHQKAPKLPILVSSNFHTEDTFLAAIRAGAQGYLLKSDADLAMEQSIKYVLSGEFPVSPALARYLFKLAGAPAATPQSESTLKLSRREQELLQHIANGHSYVSCADMMFISLSTVQTHIRNIYRKLEVRNGRQAINKAQSAGLIRM
jgi:DNA-binding NarL/FixJ family response regulator